MGTVQQETVFNIVTMQNEFNDYDNSFMILLFSVISFVVWFSDNEGTLEGPAQEKKMTMVTALAMYEELTKYDNVDVYLTHTDDDRTADPLLVRQMLSQLS